MRKPRSFKAYLCAQRSISVLDKALTKYLTQYAEIGIAQELSSALLPRIVYGSALVIPACAEGSGLLNTLHSIQKNSHPVLVLVVLNARVDATQEVHQSNQETLIAITDSYGTGASLCGGQAIQFEHPCGTLIVIDHFTEGRRLAAKQGVGLARKIGTDAALKIWSEGRVLSAYIHSSDADVLFPADMFQQVLDASPRESHSAILFPFWHEPAPDTPNLREANAQYEIKLRYYVLGLKYANSPYAFHTIGSTIAVHAHDYARVRGFPKRQAAEDFYLLNKLAKIRPISQATGDPIKLQGRCSDRVPFGTGKALMELSQDPDKDYLLYAPQAFIELKKLLERAEESTTLQISLRESLRTRSDTVLLNTLETLGFLDAIDDNLERGTTAEQKARNFHTFFDAFKTLKLIHHLRDEVFPSVPLSEALKQATFVPATVGKMKDLDAIRKALQDFENKN